MSNLTADKHLQCITKALNVPLETSAFASVPIYKAFERLLKNYAISTAENYAWRLHRFLAEDKDFPPALLTRYKDLVAHYKNNTIMH